MVTVVTADTVTEDTVMEVTVDTVTTEAMVGTGATVVTGNFSSLF